MALTLQIKRSTGTTAPSSLADGELAYTHGNEKFYIGDGSTVKLIGGKAYNDLIDHTTGTLTASSAILVDSIKAIDDFIVGNNSTTGGSMKFKEGTSNGTDHVALKAPNSLGASVTFTLPNADGSLDRSLQQTVLVNYLLEQSHNHFRLLLTLVLMMQYLLVRQSHSLVELVLIPQ